MRRSGFALGAAALAAAALVAHLVIAFELNDNPGARFADQVNGRAARPYVYRVLAPLLARQVAAVVPPAWTRAIADVPRVRRFFESRGWDWEGSHHASLAGFAVMYSGLVGLAWAGRMFFATFFDESLAAGLALLALAGTPFAWGEYGYLYDFPHVALFTLALALLARGRWRAYSLLFPVLCVSKETSVLLVPLFALSAREALPRRSFAALLAGQAAVWAVSRAALVGLMASRPGGMVEHHLDDHNLPMWTAFLTTGEGAPNVLALAVLIALVFWRFPGKPTFLRHCLWLLPPLLVLAASFGYFEERRQYMELYAPILGLVAAGWPGAGPGLAAAPRTPS